MSELIKHVREAANFFCSSFVFLHSPQALMYTLLTNSMFVSKLRDGA